MRSPSQGKIRVGSKTSTLPVAAARPCDMARVSVGNSSDGSSHVVALGPHCPKKLPSITNAEAQPTVFLVQLSCPAITR